MSDQNEPGPAAVPPSNHEFRNNAIVALQSGVIATLLAAIIALLFPIIQEASVSKEDMALISEYNVTCFKDSLQLESWKQNNIFIDGTVITKNSEVEKLINAIIETDGKIRSEKYKGHQLALLIITLTDQRKKLLDLLEHLALEASAILPNPTTATPTPINKATKEQIIKRKIILADVISRYESDSLECENK